LEEGKKLEEKEEKNISKIDCISFCYSAQDASNFLIHIKYFYFLKRILS